MTLRRLIFLTSTFSVLMQPTLAGAEEISPFLTQPRRTWEIIAPKGKCSITGRFEGRGMSLGLPFYMYLSKPQTAGTQVRFDASMRDMNGRAGYVLALMVNGALLGKAPIEAGSDGTSFSLTFHVADDVLTSLGTAPDFVLAFPGPKPTTIFTVPVTSLDQGLALAKYCGKTTR